MSPGQSCLQIPEANNNGYEGHFRVKSDLKVGRLTYTAPALPEAFGCPSII